jgi:hypothetical protein
MQKISRKTLELVLKSFEAVSKDETRLNLNAVRLGSDDNGLIVESCDGHILSRHLVDEGHILSRHLVDEEELTIDEDILIHRDSKSKLKSFITTNKHDNSFLIDTNVEENKNLRIFTSDNRDGVILSVVFRDYPKTDSIIPKVNHDDYLEVNFNPDLLAKLYKSLNGEKRRPKVKLLVKKDNPMSPIVVESGQNNIGLLMPLKV